jgi:anti-sigma factor RsiW
MGNEASGEGLTCSQAERRMSEYLDGELEVEALVAVERHLSDCPRCRRFARELVATILAIRSLHCGCRRA